MEILLQFWDIIAHIDRHLAALLQEYGVWIYALLFVIIFVETGVVVMPFLPGDSLLFVVGTLCGAGLMNLPYLAWVSVAACLNLRIVRLNPPFRAA